MGSSRSEQACARSAANAAWAFQRWFKAWRAAAAHHGARWRALAHASSRKNVGAAADSPANFHAEDNQAAAPSLPQFRVSSVFAVDCLVEGEARLVVSPWAGLAIPSDWAHDCGVHRDLGALPYRATSMRRPSPAGTSRLRSRRATCDATRAPASLQMRAAARSKGPALRASTPTCAQAERWSPYSSKRPPQGQRFGASGSGRRSLRRSMTRYSESGTRVSALVGRAVKAQLAASPACDSSSARDVGSMSLKSISSARLSRAFDAARCQPGLAPGADRVVRGAGAAASSSGLVCRGYICPTEVGLASSGNPPRPTV